jgi:hypothetical protein
MKEDLKILKEVFTWKHIAYGILFNVLAFTFMYATLDLFLYMRYDLGWI